MQGISECLLELVNIFSPLQTGPHFIFFLLSLGSMVELEFFFFHLIGMCFSIFKYVSNSFVIERFLPFPYLEKSENKTKIGKLAKSTAERKKNHKENKYVKISIEL